MSAADRSLMDWIREHPWEWAFVIADAHRLSKSGYVYAGYLVQRVRNELHVSMDRSLAWPIAKVLESNYPELRGRVRA